MKSNRYWVILYAIVVIICAAAAVLIMRSGTVRGSTARIYLSGNLAETVNLDTITEQRTILLTSEAGNRGLNIVEVEQGRIRVAKSDCPHGICVKQGWISSGVIPIVCLPNRLVIEIDRYTDIDGVVR